MHEDPERTTLDYRYDGNFFRMFLETDDRGLGNSHRPTTLRIDADQMQEINKTHHGSGVSISFVGELEFREFCLAVVGLAATLKRYFPDQTGVTAAKDYENVVALEDARHAVKNT